MSKDSLFKAIRNEDVVLWVGAGFSRYAGYPAGASLKDILYSSLSSSDKKAVTKNAPLAQLVDEIITIQLGSRQYINDILLQLYRAKPLSTETHDLLAKIPHIKYIVTTNYDTMIENAIQNSHVVVHSKDIAYTHGKVPVYKIHGDLKDLDSIILGSKDYRHFFNKENDSLMWDTIKSLAAKHTILFVGYGFEDPNVIAMFERVFEAIKDNMKVAYLVAPKLPKIKIASLQSQRIRFIKSTGEQLIEDIIQDIKSNLSKDIEHALTSATTATQFIRGLGLQGTFINESNGIKLNNLVNISGPTERSLTWRIRQNSTLRQSLYNIATGKVIGKIKLTNEDIASATLSVHGIPLFDVDELHIGTLPLKKMNFDVEFEDGAIFRNISTEVFIIPSEVQLSIYFQNISITLNSSSETKNEVNFSFSRIGPYISTSHAIEVVQFLRHSGLGKSFTLIREDGQIVEHKLNTLPQLTALGDSIFIYVKALQLIEKKFKFKFKNITDIDKYKEDTENLYNILVGTKLDLAGKDTVLTASLDGNEGIDEWIESIKNEPIITIDVRSVYNFDIHGKKIEVHYLQSVEVKDPIFSIKGTKHVITSATKNTTLKFIFPIPEEFTNAEKT